MYALAAAFVVVTTAQTSIGVVVNRSVIRLARPDRTIARNLLAAAWPLAVGSIAVMVYYRLAHVVLFRTWGAAEVGYFSAAYRFIDVAQLMPAMIAAPLLPLVAKHRGVDRRRLTIVLSLSSRALIVLGIGTAIVLGLLSRPLVVALYGHAYVRAADLLPVLGVAFIGVCLGWLGTTTCIAAGATRKILAVTGSAAVFNLAAQLVVVPRWGAMGAAVLAVPTEMYVGMTTCVVACRVLGARMPIRLLLTTLGLGVVALAPAVALQLPPLIAAAAALLIFGVGLALTGVGTRADLSRLWSRGVL
jgi:O-antigen/teichoic acid export membrane protein